MELKEYQQGVLTKFDRYLSTLSEQVEKVAKARAVLRVQEIDIDPGDPCVKAWVQLNHERRLPHLRDEDGREVVAPYRRGSGLVWIAGLAAQSRLPRFSGLHSRDQRREVPVRRDDDLMSIGMPPFLLAAFLRHDGETVPAQDTGDFGGRTDREMPAHVSATSSTFAPGARSRATGSNHKASASRALAMASFSVSPALAQPGISGKTADHRPVAGSCSTTRRTFMPGL